MKSLWIVLLMLLLAESCLKDIDEDKPSIIRIRYEILNSYEDTLYFDVEYLLLSGEQQAESFEIIPGEDQVLFSMAYVAGTHSYFKCSNQLVSLSATNRQGNIMLKDDPLVPEWWKHIMVPVGIDTFHICSCNIDSALIIVNSDSLGIASGMEDIKNYSKLHGNQDDKIR